MKIKILLVVLILFCSSELFSQSVGDAYAMEINSIYLPLNRKGVLADVDYWTNGSGGQFGGNVFLFSVGFFLSGYSNGTLWANSVASATLVEDYVPGTVNNSLATLYKLSSSDPPFISQSWQDWQNAVALGADYYDGDGNGYYDPIDWNNNGIWDPDEDRPDILGDETLWCVYNDGLPSSLRRWNTVEPQGIEIRQTVFAYDTITELQNIIYIRYRIKNTGAIANEMTNVYFGIWDDPDLGTSNNDLVGCDTLLNGQYTYNWYSDPIYGNNPPSFFAQTLSGPVTYIPGVTFQDNNGNGVYDEGIDVALDTAYIRRGQILGIKEYPGARNQKISSMVHYINGDPIINDPANAEEARNYMLGLTRDGQMIDPCTWQYGAVQGGVDCSQVNPMFWYSGDRVNNYGCVNTTPTDQRQLHNVGPFTLKAGEEYEVFVAYNIGQGTDAFSSITEVKNIAFISQIFHACNFNPAFIVSVDEQLEVQPDKYVLSQNYPNPFNPSTKISWQVPVGGDVVIKVYDVLGNEIAILVDEYKPAGSYEVEWNASAIGGGLPSGVYFYQLKTKNFVDTRKMIMMR